MSFTPLKYIYNQFFLDNFSKELAKEISHLDCKEFISNITTKGWETMELKARMKHISFTLNKYLSSDFEFACKQILAIIKTINITEYKYGALAFMFLPDYIEKYGINHFDISMKTLKDLTHFTSSEFAVRPYIIQNQKKSLELMFDWSNNECFHIRRLASEGCRPKLPWAIALKTLIVDPNPIMPILENLKNDPEDYVYRSVANNLNDISKNHPELVINIAKKWKGNSKNTDWLVKHSLRTLFKQGNQTVMQLYGYGKSENIIITNLKKHKPIVKVGDNLIFTFTLANKKEAINRIEYAIYFLLKNGKLSKKVFKISEKVFSDNSLTDIVKKHSFRIISTRTYYKGEHKVSIIVNGIEKAITNFTLQ